MKMDILRTMAGPSEFEIRASHHFDGRTYHIRYQLDDEKQIKYAVEYCKSAIIDFAFNEIYQTHGQGD